MNTIVNDNSKIYYTGHYWNDFPKVLEYMSKNFTGDKSKDWTQDFRERFAKKPFKHGLFLNCGNGWVERNFIDQNICCKATAFDYSNELLKIAKKDKGNRNIRYFQADVNKINLDGNLFDLIVNVAALHHVQYINRLCFILAKSLKEDGVFVNFDYIGPHRNQYPLKQWFYVHKVNNSLPNFIKKTPLSYPHLPTMLYCDPTEAIHSELIFESLSRYFDIYERHDTGGGIAYIILTHNDKLANIQRQKLDLYLNKILIADAKFTTSKKVPPLFSYFIVKPNKKSLVNKKIIDQFQKIENTREENASCMEGVYNIYDYLKLIKAVNNYKKIVLLKNISFFLIKKLGYFLYISLKNLLY